MERKWSGEVGNICTDPQWAAQRMLQEQEEKGECDQGRKQRGSSRKPGDAEMLWEVSRRTWAHLQPRQSTEGSGARGAPDARPKPEPLWIVLGPGDTTWAFVFVSTGLRVQNFLPHLVSAMGPQESGSPLKQNERLDYYEGIGYYIFEPHPTALR